MLPLFSYLIHITYYFASRPQLKDKDSPTRQSQVVSGSCVTAYKLIWKKIKRCIMHGLYVTVGQISYISSDDITFRMPESQLLLNKTIRVAGLKWHTMITNPPSSQLSSPQNVLSSLITNLHLLI